MSTTSPRIERGAALLDQHAPGWTTKIDLDTLDLSNARLCIVGQVYGDYDVGLELLDGAAERSPAWHGFLAWGAESYDGLTERWREYISRRRAAA